MESTYVAGFHVLEQLGNLLPQHVDRETIVPHENLHERLDRMELHTSQGPAYACIYIRVYNGIGTTTVHNNQII